MAQGEQTRRLLEDPTRLKVVVDDPLINEALVTEVPKPFNGVVTIAGDRHYGSGNIIQSAAKIITLSYCSQTIDIALRW